MREGSNTARRQCSSWDVELSAIRRAKVLASRESGHGVAQLSEEMPCARAIRLNEATRHAFITPDLWPPNSHDLIPADSKISNIIISLPDKSA